MIRINLLPWRTAARARGKRYFLLATVAAVALTGLIGWAVHVAIAQVIAHQGARNAFLDGEIRQLDRQLGEIKELEATKGRMISRMTIIQQLQASRPAAVHLLDEVVASVPEGVFLTSLQQVGTAVSIKGRAQSNARVSGLMRNVEGAAWIGSPTLAVVENKERTGTGLNHFQVNLLQQAPKVADTELTGAGLAPAPR